MKKKSIIIFLLFACSSAFGKNNITFNLQPELSILNGSIIEYVFDDECKNTDNMLSRLNWDIKNIPVLELNSEFTLFNHITINFNGKFGIPKSSGNMCDYDWQNSVPSPLHVDWALDPATELTNYSNHENSLDKYITFSLYGGYKFILPHNFAITPFIGYEYQSFSFYASNGYSIYKEDNFQKLPFSGTVIAYEQEINSFLLGISLYSSILDKVDIKGSVIISPKLNKYLCLDRHFFGRTAYLDVLSNAFIFQSNLTANYKINKTNSIGLFGFIEYIPLIKGKNYTKSLGSDDKPVKGKWIPSSNIIKGAASRFIWSVGINYTVTF